MSIKCQYGRPAENGDYVLTLHQYSYNATVLPGRVWNGKVYTGTQVRDGKQHKNDIHKLSAITVIDPNVLTEEQKFNIQADMAESIPGYGEVPKSLDRYLAKTHFEEIDQVWEAFKLCRNSEDAEKVCNLMKYGYGGTLGQFVYSPQSKKEFSILRIAEPDSRSYIFFNYLTD